MGITTNVTSLPNPLSLSLQQRYLKSSFVSPKKLI